MRAWIAALVLLAACGEPRRPLAIDGRFAPPPDRTLLIVGQDLEAIEGYVQSGFPVPGGVTTYTDISESEHDRLLYGLTDTVNWGSGLVSARALVDAYPQSALVIGLYLVDRTGTNLMHIADGTHDGAIDTLGRFVMNSRRPVFIRIGYEFDGEWNHYDPEGYVAAFRHIVERLRSQGTSNFASVWQSATSPSGRYLGRPVEDWYPGDAWVDWMATSWFLFDETVHADFLALARSRGKPVMIAEATPQGYDLEALTHSPPDDGRTLQPLPADFIWSAWYGPFFEFIHANSDVIRAVAYINVDWNSQPMWGPEGGSGYWGDSRVQVDPVIRSRWLAEVSDPAWLHGSESLFGLLGYRSR